MYAVEMQNQFEALSKEEADQGSDREVVDRTWKLLKTSMVHAAKKVLPKKDRIKRKSWMTNEILQKMQDRKKNKGTDKYKEIDKEIRHMCKERKEAWWNEKCKEIEELERKHKTKEMHANVKEMSTKKRSKCETNCIRDKNGKMLFDSNDVINRWVEHVTELYHDEKGDPPDVSNKNGCTIMKSEIDNVITDIKCGKASGNDDIATEMIKALDDKGIKTITELCNLVYDTGYLPPDMSSSIFVRLPKKANATECSDYRTLSLVSHILKILLNVILKRNKHNIESVISETQSGFMTGKGTREGIYNLRTMIERCIKCGKNISLCFIDYEKAFDRVKHVKIVECMENLDIDGKDIYKLDKKSVLE